MSHPPGNGSELTFQSLLAARARTASDARLALDTAVGLIVGTLAVALRPPGWSVLVSGALCLVAFGLWGIIDRSVRERLTETRAHRLLLVLRAVAAALGVLAALALAATGMALMLGTWIS